MKDNETVTLETIIICYLQLNLKLIIFRMNRLLLRKILPVGAISTVLVGYNQKTALAKSEAQACVKDEFQTVRYWNDYKKIILYGYQGCPYCAKGKK